MTLSTELLDHQASIEWNMRKQAVKMNKVKTEMRLGTDWNIEGNFEAFCMWAFIKFGLLLKPKCRFARDLGMGYYLDLVIENSMVCSE